MGGLRGRLAATLALVSLVALAIAAFALLSPLDQRLRNNEIEVFVGDAKASRPALQRLPASALTPDNPRLERALRLLRRRTGSRVVAVGPTGAILGGPDTDPGERFPEATAALRRGRTQVQTISENGVLEVHVGLVITAHGRRFAIAARKPVDDASDGAAVVRRAFLVAAVLSLLGASLLGLLLAGRLVRRLRTLRDTALRVAEIGPVVEVRADDARDEVGDLTRAFATMQDRLREQEDARRSFVATASHELRTPLASLRLILGNLSDGLGETQPDLADARQQAHRADAQAERLATLAAELLDLSRIDARLPLRSELVDVGEVARSVAAEFEVRAAESGHVISLDLQTELWAVGDPGAVAQIARALIDNALRHAPSTAPVSLMVEAADGSVRFAVRDGGPGVAAPDRERIFERFERGATASSTPGFGLGLAIARELAERMDGTLTIDVRAPGCCFVLALPAGPAF